MCDGAERLQRRRPNWRPATKRDTIRLAMHPLASLGLVTAVVLAVGCRADRPSAGTPQGLRGPVGSLIPSGPLAVAIRRGRALPVATAESPPAHLRNTLRCLSGHL